MCALLHRPVIRIKFRIFITLASVASHTHTHTFTQWECCIRRSVECISPRFRVRACAPHERESAHLLPRLAASISSRFVIAKLLVWSCGLCGHSFFCVTNLMWIFQLSAGKHKFEIITTYATNDCTYFHYFNLLPRPADCLYSNCMCIKRADRKAPIAQPVHSPQKLQMFCQYLLQRPTLFLRLAIDQFTPFTSQWSSNLML